MVESRALADRLVLYLPYHRLTRGRLVLDLRVARSYLA